MPGCAWFNDWRLAILACCCLIPSGNLQAGPRINSLSAHGLRSGATTTLTIAGTDLLPGPQLMLPVPMSNQVVRPGATPNQVQLDVTLPAETSPGLYPLRIANAKGISNSVTVSIDDLEQMPFSSKFSAAPIALVGRLSGSTVLETSFAGRKGQHIIVEIEARRLGAEFEPIMELYGSRQVQIAWAQGHAALGGDARLEATLPADSVYKIALHDALFRGGEPGMFRLKVGELSCADLIFPLGGQRGTIQNFEILGPGFISGQQLTVDLRNRNGDFPCPLPGRRCLTGPVPRIVLGDFPEVVKCSPLGGKLQELTAPVVIDGRLAKPGDEDRYRLLVKPGSRWRIDVLASRAGSPLDGVLSIQNEAGAQLVANDDRGDTTDPGFDFAVPTGMNAAVLGIKDLLGRGGPNFVYRISVTPLDQPDFRLRFFEAEHAVPQGGVSVLRVHADRAGYNGTIALRLVDLPSGVTADPIDIPPRATDALLTFRAPANSGLSHGFVQIVGDGREGETPIHRRAESPSPVTGSLALAVMAPSTLTIAWDDSADSLFSGGQAPLKMRLTRAQGADAPVRLTLLTNQVVPRTPDGKQEDVNRALRLAPSAPIPGNQTAAQVNAIVPADLPAIPYDLAIRAEMLGPDGNTVLASAVTPGRRVQIKTPKK
jgi:hypothetical protein